MSSLSDRLNRALGASESTNEGDYKQFVQDVDPKHIDEESQDTQEPQNVEDSTNIQNNLDNLVKTPQFEFDKTTVFNEEENNVIYESQNKEEESQHPVEDTQVIEKPSMVTFESGHLDERQFNPNTSAQQESQVKSETINVFDNNNTNDIFKTKNTNSFEQYPSSQTNYFNNNDINLNENIISKIIVIYDEFNNLDEQRQKRLIDLLKINTDNILDENNKIKKEKVILNILNADLNRIQAMKNLITLHSEDPVSMAFSLVEMSYNELRYIEDLLIDMSNGKLKVENSLDENKIKYCRELQRVIASIPDKLMEDLKPLGKILEKGIE